MRGDLHAPRLRFVERKNEELRRLAIRITENGQIPRRIDKSLFFRIPDLNSRSSCRIDLTIAVPRRTTLELVLALPDEVDRASGAKSMLHRVQPEPIGSRAIPKFNPLHSAAKMTVFRQNANPPK